MNLSKDKLYERFSRIGKAVSSPKRLELLDLLCQGEKTVEALSGASSLELKNTSAQLKELKNARLVESRRSGRFVYYRLADDSVSHFWISLRTLAEQRLGDRSVQMTQKEDLAQNVHAPLSRTQILARARRGEVVLIDVRPRDEYQAGHLPFAISVPPTDLRKRTQELPKSKLIVAYCRGPYCEFAQKAVNFLRRRGFRAMYLEEGVAEWKAAGLKIEHSSDDHS